MADGRVLRRTGTVVGATGEPERLVMRQKGSAVVVQLERLPEGGDPYYVPGYYGAWVNEAGLKEVWETSAARFPAAEAPRQGMLF